MRLPLAIAFTAMMSLSAFAQATNEAVTKNQIQNVETPKYVYLTIEERGLSSKLDVKVDFGDTEQLIKLGEEYSKALTGKRSYAAILNYMAERNYELVERKELVNYYKDNTRTNFGVTYIMKKIN